MLGRARADAGHDVTSVGYQVGPNVVRSSIKKNAWVMMLKTITAIREQQVKVRVRAFAGAY